MHMRFSFQATRLQSTDQSAGLVYADIGSTLPLNSNAKINILLQLDDDCVQYADVKHHQDQQSPEVHYTAVSNSGMLAHL